MVYDLFTPPLTAFITIIPIFVLRINKSYMLELLKKHFGYDSFRPMQQEIIEHILAHRDALVLMPTGGGKSICYQLPALMSKGVTVVVSPLISLMRDQVEALRANNIPAAALNSNNNETSNAIIRRECVEGRIKLLYISPERLMLEGDGLLRDMQIALFAIDEAHCISQWGHDFRPEYTQLGQLREQFPEIPMVALTATADKVTREDILKQLKLKDPRIFISSFDRPNLSLNVLRGYTRKEKTKAIADFITQRPNRSGIIYCQSRKGTEELTAKLHQLGILVDYYHAGLSAQERNRVQDEFINDRLQVVCATIAFGMGIDKSNVRWVIHYNLPKSIESFYQEIGRAGRDGEPSETLLFYSFEDLIVLQKFAEESGQAEINKERLDRMKEYAEASICRRRILLSYFGENSDHDCQNCDICRNPPQRFDGTLLVQKALSGIMRCEQQITMHVLIDLLRGTMSNEIASHGYHRLKTFGVGRDIPGRDWKDFLLQMLQLGYIEIAYNEKNHLKVTPQGREVLFGRSIAQLSTIQPEEEKVVKKRTKKETKRATETKGTKERESPMEELSLRRPQNRKGRLTLFGGAPLLDKQESEQLFEELRALRRLIAEEELVPPYVVMSDKVLHQLCNYRPTTIEAFGEINGIGEYKKKKYGERFTQAIKRFIG